MSEDGSQEHKPGQDPQNPDPVPAGLTPGGGKLRCSWAANSAVYNAYHDEEWGRPTHDDRRLFEKVCLEGFQSGLSWLTILQKRENFRQAFHRFEIAAVAKMTADDVERLLTDTGIVRHRKKIESTVNNAKRALELQREAGSLAAFFWSYERAAHEERGGPVDYEFLSGVTKTQTSDRLSKDLKKRGWSFVGPTTMYAFMQAMGLVNDHPEGCHSREICLKARAQFEKPEVSAPGK